MSFIDSYIIFTIIEALDRYTISTEMQYTCKFTHLFYLLFVPTVTFSVQYCDRL